LLAASINFVFKAAVRSFFGVKNYPKYIFDNCLKNLLMRA